MPLNNIPKPGPDPRKRVAPILVSVPGTRADADDHAVTSLLATQQPDGAWLVNLGHLERAGMWVTEPEMVRWATAVLHLVPAEVARAAWVAVHPQGGMCLFEPGKS